MGRTVSELRASLTADELAYWIAINRRAPIGDDQLDYLVAHVCLRIFQAAGIKKPREFGRPRPPRPEDWQLGDFLLFKEETDEKPLQQTPLEFMRSRVGHLVERKAA